MGQYSQSKAFLGESSRGTYNLWQIQGIVPNGVENQVLQLVHYAKQILSQGSHGRGVED